MLLVPLWMRLCCLMLVALQNVGLKVPFLKGELLDARAATKRLRQIAKKPQRSKQTIDLRFFSKTSPLHKSSNAAGKAAHKAMRKLRATYRPQHEVPIGAQLGLGAKPLAKHNQKAAAAARGVCENVPKEHVLDAGDFAEHLWQLQSE